MNVVILIGRLTKDPDIRYLNNQEQTCVANYTLAVDRRSKNGEQTADFIRCVTFGKTAEFAQNYLHKGMKIAVEGEIQTGSYEDRETGKTVYTTTVKVHSHEFCEKRENNQSGYGQDGGYNQGYGQTGYSQGGQQRRQGQNGGQNYQPQQAPNDGFEPIDESVQEQLPFV